MNEHRILKVTDDVHWIGVLDRDIVTFDVVMETKYGTTYNSYFIHATKKTIVETVKEKFWDTYYEKICQLTDPAEIEYIVLNHTEPDHSGCVAKLLEVAPKATVVGSGNAIRYLKDLIGFEPPHLILKDQQVLDLGNKTLKLIGAPNLHWPDSTMMYLAEDRLLFTCDIFGEHYCHEEMFDDAVGNFDDAFRYYYNVIMRPYSRFMLQALDKMRNLDIHTICPGHGVILRSFWKKYVDLTEQYAHEAMQYPIQNRVLMAYVSAYKNTGLLAEKIAEGIREAGDIEVEACDIEGMDLNALEIKLMEASAIIVGCPTFSQNILLPIYQLFAFINPIRDRGKLAAAFGSYGWSGEGNKLINSNLVNLKLKLFDEGLQVKFKPHEEVFEKCRAYGKAFGTKFLEKE